jgi:hypothetical protein
MPPIDYSIPGQFKGIQIESPMNAMAQAMQLRGLQESSQMNALKAQEYQQQVQERNALAQLMSDPNLEFGTEPFMRQVLAKAPSMYEGIATRAAQRENLLAQREGRQAETEKRQFESEKLKGQLSKEQFQTAINELAGYDTVADVLSGVQQKLDAGVITRAQADQVIAGLPQNDSEIPAWQIRTMRGLLTPKEKLEDVRAEKKDVREEKRAGFEEQRLGFEEQRVGFERERLGFEGTRLENEAARLKLEDARIQEQMRHANAMESIGRAGADRAALQAEETQRHNKEMERLRRAEINKPSAGENPNKVAHTSTDDQGNVTFYNAFGQVIRTQANAGKRSPNLIKTEQAEKNLSRDIERTSKELADITKDGGLIDQSTGSYIGKAVDIGARVFGQATPGDIASAKLAPIADMVLKMVPRFEGPQSDKDTLSYKQAAGQLNDATLPAEIRKEAGRTILRLMKERKDQFVGEGMDTSSSQRKAPPPPSGFVPDKK